MCSTLARILALHFSILSMSVSMGLLARSSFLHLPELIAKCLCAFGLASGRLAAP